MNILLQINSVVNYGSTGRIVEEIGQMSMENGWKSMIAYGRYDRESKSELFKIGSEFDVNLHGLQTRLFDRHGLGSCSATKKLITQINKVRPNIIHLHNLHGYYLNIKLLFEYLATSNIPVVWTLHDCWPITGHCVYFDYVNCEKWKTKCFTCPQKKEYPASFGYDRSSQNYDLKKELFTSLRNLTIVPVSLWLSDIIEQSYLAKFPLQVINNGINTDVFKPLQNSHIRNNHYLKDKFMILGIASDWSPRKGLKDFIELSKRLNSDFQIVLIGLSKSQRRDLPQNIIGIERTEDINELVRIYSSSNVFINPTWEDNFPTTNLEAMACGTPVITYNTGGSVESVIPETGIIVEKGDINGLVQAIRKIQTKKKESYSKACIERVYELYNKNDRYDDYMRLYKSLLE